MKYYNVTKDYLAGVLDSDGSFTISKRHLKRKNINYIVMIQITWTKSKISKQIFETLTRYYGGSYCEIKPHNKSLAKRASYKYCATGKAAHRILLDCRNNVLLKNEQVKNCLEVLKLIEHFKKNYAGKNRPRIISKLLETLYKKNLKANFIHDKSR